MFFHQTDTGVSAAGAGLVHSATSDTGSTDKAFRAERGARRAESAYGTRPAIAGAIEIDPHAVRLRRLKKNVITSARLHEQELQGRRYKAAMVTLTYRDDVEWTPKQVTGYLKAVREWYRRKHGQALRYVWVLELTKRGRPHYHVLFWLPKGVSMPKADKRGWWPWGFTKTEWARRPVGYLAKYASKGDAERMPPKGARLYGVGGLQLLSRLERAWWNLPLCVREWGTPLDRWRRATGGGWLCRASGEWRPSQWAVVFLGGRVFAVPKPQPSLATCDRLHPAS